MTDWLGMAAAPRPPRPELKARVMAHAAAAGRRRPGRRLALAALLVVGLGTGAVWVRVTLQALAQERAERATLATRVAALEDTLSLLRGRSTRVYQVPISTNGRVGAVTIFEDSVTHRWLVSCSGLAPNDPREAYQIWFITDAGARSAAVMPMDEDQAMVMGLDMPRDGGRVTGAAMSIEPRAGSPGPTGPMVFRLTL